MIQQLKIQNEVIIDEKTYYIKEAEQYKEKTKDVESNMLGRIKQIQDLTNKEKDNIILNYEAKLKDSKDKFEKQINSIRNEYDTCVSEKEKKIDGLTSHLKSYTDHQYITLNENEKLKTINNKLKMDCSGFDSKLSETHFQYKKEFDDSKISFTKEKDILIDSYNETIKKSQELNDALQNRLNQTIEALGLSKTTITNLKETNQNLEKQIQSKESEDNSYQEKYSQLKNENIVLRDKFERSIELNNSFSSKEKQYEAQIKQLNIRCNQLFLLSKKNMNSSNQ